MSDDRSLRLERQDRVDVGARHAVLGNVPAAYARWSERQVRIVELQHHPVQGLTIEFGGAISTFRCASCGAVEIRGKRVVLREELAACSAHAFQALAGVATQ